MTAILAWITKNPGHGFGSLYFASDSRLCFEVTNNGTMRYHPKTDNYQKTFVSQTTPDIFAICGKVGGAHEFLQHTQSVLSAARASVQAPLNEPVLNAYSLDVFNRSVSTLTRHKMPGAGLIVIHGYRFGTNSFGLTRHEFVNAADRCCVHSVPFQLSTNGGLLWRDGKAAELIERVQTGDREKDARGYSRWFWQTFCDVLLEQLGDITIGGSPQVVGLYNKGNGQVIGVYYKTCLYVSGQPVNILPEHVTECRDVLFQRVDASGVLVTNAQRHARNNTDTVQKPLV